jgi:DNA adenine methylase
MNSPIKWYGGKSRLASWVISHFHGIKHDVYVEPCCGGASVFFAKQPSPLEVLNDIDNRLYEFFTVLADENMFERFRRIVEALPWSRGMFNQFCDYCDYFDSSNDIVHRAAMFFYIARQSFSSDLGKTWAYTRKDNDRRSQTKTWMAAVDRLYETHKRICMAQIESLDIVDCMNLYDSKTTLFYIDPPYVMESRKSKVEKYDYEMSNDKHVALVERLITQEGKTLLSGYESPIYQLLLDHGWMLKKKQVHCSAAGRVRHSSLQGSGNAIHQTRTECLYISPNAKAETLLF